MHRSPTRALTAILALAAASSFAQTEEEGFHQFQFSFQTPGARATGMGRTFIGLADDASAAESNPAGLTTLVHPEIAAEFRSTKYSTERLAAADSLSTGEDREFGERESSPAFLSGVVPIGDLVVAAYRQVYLDYGEAFSLEPRSVPGAGVSVRRTEAAQEFTGVNWGLALSYRLGQLSLGVTGKVSTLDVESVLLRFCGAPGGCGGTPQGGVFNATTMDDSDTRIGFSGGLSWRPNEQFALGAVYSYNPRFRIEADATEGRSGSLRSIPGFPREIAFSIPDRLGAGASAKLLGSRLTLGGDLVWVRYSELAGENLTAVSALDAGRSFAEDDFRIEDAVEVHGGVEWVQAIGSTHLGLRAGVFTVPDHSLEYHGETASTLGRVYDGLINSGDRDTEIGLTFGVGFKIQGALQIDAAYVRSDPADELTVSAVWKFGKRGGD